MRETHITTPRKLLAKFFAEVQSGITRSCNTATRTSSHTTTTLHTGEHGRGQIRETHVVGIVHSSHKGYLIIVDETVDHRIAFVTVFTTITRKGITEPTLFHTRFDSQVDHGLLFAIIKTGHQRHIALLIQYLYLINHLRRQILGSYLRIIGEEFFTINQHLLDLLTVDRHLTIAIDLDTRHLLQQIFQHSTLTHFIGFRIVFNGIVPDRHFSSLPDHNSFTQLNRTIRQCHRTQLLWIGCSRHPYRFIQGIKTHKRDVKQIITLTHIFESKITVRTTGYTSHQCAILHLQQADGCLFDRHICTLLNHTACQINGTILSPS